MTCVAEAELTPRAGQARSAQTRAAIIEAALRLFREAGYEATTMRAIAREAGVSTGNAYYYFSSKEELIRAFYARNQAEHDAACRPVLAAETEFAPRLRGTLRALVDVLGPYHAFAAKFFKHAAEPSNPLSPFSSESGPVRASALDLYREVVDGSSVRLGPDLRAELPELLWLYSLGIVMFWVHDTSPGCAKTYRLIDRTVPIADRLMSMSRLPVLRSTLTDVISIIDEMRG